MTTPNNEPDASLVFAKIEEMWLCQCVYCETMNQPLGCPYHLCPYHLFSDRSLDTHVCYSCRHMLHAGVKLDAS